MILFQRDITKFLKIGYITLEIGVYHGNSYGDIEYQFGIQSLEKLSLQKMRLRRTKKQKNNTEMMQSLLKTKMYLIHGFQVLSGHLQLFDMICGSESSQIYLKTFIRLRFSKRVMISYSFGLSECSYFDMSLLEKLHLKQCISTDW